jgi:hypothetical protein
MGLLQVSLGQGREMVADRLGSIVKKDVFCCRAEKIVWPSFFIQNGRLFDVKRAEIALLSPRPDMTVYVCNLADGWASLFESIVRESGLGAYFFRSTLSVIADYKVFEMTHWRGGEPERRVRLLQETDKWSFTEAGKPLLFEEVDRYKARSIRDRMNNDLLVRYSETAGFGINSVTRFDGGAWHFWREVRASSH